MKKYRTTAKVAVAALLVIICAAAFGADSQEGDGFAILKQTRGKVLVKSAGELTWHKAKSGDELFYGDTVKTKEMSSAIVYIDPGNYVKLMPLTEMQLAEFLAEDGYHSTIFNVGIGKILSKTDVPDEEGQVVVKVKDAVLRGSYASAFIEASGSSAGCVDLIKGVAAVATVDTPGDEVIITPGQRIAVDSGIMSDIETLQEMLGENVSPSHTCLPEKKEEEQKQETGTTAAQGDTAQGTATETPAQQATVEEGEDGEYVVFNVTTSITFVQEQSTGEQSDSTQTTDESPAVESPSDLAASISESSYEEDQDSGSASSSSSYEEEEDDTEEEYMSVIMTANVDFVEEEKEETPAGTQTAEETAEEAAPCEEYPEIFDVTVTDEDVDDQGEVVMESDYACDMHATATIRWSAALECGAVTAMTIGEVEKASFPYDGGDEGETLESVYEFIIIDNKPKEMIIKAVGSNDKESFYTFTIQLQGQSLTALPQLTDVKINGQTVESGDSLEIRSTDCGIMKLEFTGTAYSECGDLKEVSGELDGSDMEIRGRDTWKTEETFTEDTSFTVQLTAEDVTDRKSEVFEFDVDLVRDIDLPEFEIETIGGEPVVAFGDPMELFRNSLVNNQLIFAGSANSNHCSITRAKVGINEDDPDSMQTADGTTSWSYSIPEPSDGEYEIYGYSYDDTGAISEEMSDAVYLIYSHYTLEEKLEMTFKEQMQAYNDLQTSDFMELTGIFSYTGDPSISSTSMLEQALDAKSTELGDTYDISYTISSVTVSGDTGTVFFYWDDANPANPTNSHTAIFEYTKTPGTGWKLATVSDDNTFLRHTDKAAYITIAAEGGDTTLMADAMDTVTVIVKVYDSAYNPVKDGTMVSISLSTNFGEIDPTGMTEAGIVELEYTADASYSPPDVAITATSGSVSSSALELTLIGDNPGLPDEEE